MKPLFLLISSILVPISSIQESLGSTVFLGQAEGMLVTTNYQSSEATDILAASNPEEANRLFGMTGNRPKTGEIEGDSNMIGKGKGALGKTKAGTSIGVDEWDRTMEASKLCNQALLHIKRENFLQAIRVLDQAIIVAPNHARARLLRGVVAEKRSKHQEAIGFYDRALMLDPTGADIYQSRGISYMELKNNQAAISDFTKAMELDPKLVEAYLKRGLLYGKLGRFEESIADNTAAIALDPESVLAYNNRSAAYKALGKLNEARADIQMLKKLQQTRK